VLHYLSQLASVNVLVSFVGLCGFEVFDVLAEFLFKLLINSGNGLLELIDCSFRF